MFELGKFLFGVQSHELQKSMMGTGVDRGQLLQLRVQMSWSAQGTYRSPISVPALR